ncbi:hypothetical protein Phum_PHUM449390 [Pediculus humanus corporis]|uniref:C2H2-type domain-containing protein n=1 Tax=Pediculus humanus subsp. corporis TaxID=121224 RepID=E0VUD6_PEDHC|nr:uncharacterized protein Phum_PHUM449390 [Pediculus humanus corporis]EEB16992.1 hypothetical protein Phum_PHUM449390 [Pediculus humanus corporis]
MNLREYLIVGARGQIMFGNKTSEGNQLTELPWPPSNPKLNKRLMGCHICPNCDRVYSSKATLTRHLRAECGIGSRIQCPYCPHKAKRSDHLLVHIKKIHKEITNH